MGYVRKLKLLGVGVQFEKKGISTLSMGEEMLLNTFSALAQEEPQSIIHFSLCNIHHSLKAGFFNEY